ncbi:MAG: PKD domain-containing protein [Archangium sp.]|nr:PKD domain-containing protein [Archangium sp.]
MACALVGASCVIAETLTARGELATESGVPVTFTAARPLTWDFGDGATATSARTAAHAYLKPGRYTVRGASGGSREEWSVIVGPRPAAHLVPPDADWAVLGTQSDALMLGVDTAERVIGPEAVRRWLELHPLHGWLVEVEKGEDAALFAWPDAENATVAVVGRDDGLKSGAFREWLLAHDWVFANEVQGLSRYEKDDRALDVFVDRNALYAVESALLDRVPSAQSRVAAASALGLGFDPAVNAALDSMPSGAVMVVTRTNGSLLAGVVRFQKNRATWEGRLIRNAPAWSAITSADGSAGGRDAGVPESLLATAPNGAIATASTSATLADLASALGGVSGLPELVSGLRGLSGRVELSFYFDVESFVRATLSGNGLPEPRGLLLIEAGVRDASAVRPLIDALARRWDLPLEFKDGIWNGHLRGMPLTVRLTETKLVVRGGADVTERKPVDLRAQFPEGSLGPGHVAARLDLGRLREELLFPRRLTGVDPRRALVAQAAAVTVIDRITRVDSATLLLQPAPDGAKFELTLELRPPLPRE